VTAAKKLTPPIPAVPRKGRIKAVVPRTEFADRCTFVVPGIPVPKQRPRVTRRGTFMPAHYVAWKECCRDEAAVVFAEFACRGTPWDAQATAYAMTVRAYLPHSNGGDADSLGGAVMDALNKFAFPDDRFVADLRVLRFVDKVNPRLEVELRIFAPGRNGEEDAR